MQHYLCSKTKWKITNLSPRISLILKKKIYPKYVLISSSGVIFVNGLYCVLLLKYFKIYSEQLINYRAADKL